MRGAVRCCMFPWCCRRSAYYVTREAVAAVQAALPGLLGVLSSEDAEALQRRVRANSTGARRRDGATASHSPPVVQAWGSDMGGAGAAGASASPGPTKPQAEAAAAAPDVASAPNAAAVGDVVAGGPQALEIPGPGPPPAVRGLPTPPPRPPVDPARPQAAVSGRPGPRPLPQPGSPAAVTTSQQDSHVFVNPMLDRSQRMVHLGQEAP
jgi:hypothetical protein